MIPPQVEQLLKGCWTYQNNDGLCLECKRKLEGWLEALEWVFTVYHTSKSLDETINLTAETIAKLKEVTNG